MSRLDGKRADVTVVSTWQIYISMSPRLPEVLQVYTYVNVRSVNAA